MIVGIHKDPYGKFCKFLQRYEAILDHNGIEHIRLEASEHDFWGRVEKLDLFIFRWRQYDDQHHKARTIINIVEKEMRIKCFPNIATSWHFDDKIRQYYLLRYHGLPVIESWAFWEKQPALNWLESAQMPVVFKLKGGAGSHNVLLIDNRKEAKRLIKRMFGKGVISGHLPHPGNVRRKDSTFYKTIYHWGGNVRRRLRNEDVSPDWIPHKNYVLFQLFLPGNDCDTRVTVIGRRAFAFRRFNRDGDFRASGSGNMDFDVSGIDPRCLKMAFEASKRLNFQCMAYDFLNDENGEPKIAEMSYTFIDKAVFECPGYYDDNLKFHEGHFWPQYFHLVDALNLNDLKQPVMDN